uniref:Cadherin-20 n=1 Tax=Geotrypetes seraphini TaxID=260995 RepID=A0A6P8PRL6_GEOSA|nr:cadherin-20 isoform X2 [Geotrypetes seraphini]
MSSTGAGGQQPVKVKEQREGRSLETAGLRSRCLRSRTADAKRTWRSSWVTRFARGGGGRRSLEGSDDDDDVRGRSCKREGKVVGEKEEEDTIIKRAVNSTLSSYHKSLSLVIFFFLIFRPHTSSCDNIIIFKKMLWTVSRLQSGKSWFRLCFSLYSLMDLTATLSENPKPLSEASEDNLLDTLFQHHRLKRSWVWNQFFVLEEYTGTDPLYVGKLHSDMDKGDGSIKYILSGDGAGTMFTIDDTTGDIHAIQRLDREERSQYTLRAQALDRRTGRPMEPESEFIIKIQDINDNEPKFLNGPYAASVPEMSPVGTSIIQVIATDADDPTYGNSARVVYSILQGQPYFSVDSKTGIIRTALTNMDREAREYYEVIIQAKDMSGLLGGLAGTTTVNITLSDVNDNPPRFLQKHYQMSILESAPVSSTVGRVLAKDLDEGINAELKYSLVDGDGLDVFDIATDSKYQAGIITVRKPLNFETKRSYTLKVEGANTQVEMRFLNLGPFRDTTTVHIGVEDVDEPPVFEASFYFVEVPEDVDIGTTIQIVSARDPDVTNNSIRSSDPGRFFYVDITTGALMTARPLDREDIAWHNITVLAMEMNNPIQIESVAITVKILDVNDNAPKFDKFYEAHVCENAKAGQLIDTVSAVDQDDPPEGQHFYYSLAPEAENNPNFTLRDNQDNTAWILTRRSGYRQRSQNTFYLPILIADNGHPMLSSTGTFTIQVCLCDNNGDQVSCSPEAYTLPISLSRGALLAILGCIFVLLVLVLFMLSMRRYRKQPYIINEDENVHENIVRYDDEGGGEEDTEAFNIAAMWNPREAQMLKTRQDIQPEIESLSRYVPQTCMMHDNIHNYVLARLYEADIDFYTPPFDSLQTYMFEGDGSVAQSLSSLQSVSTDSDQSYDYLTDWGPHFKKLAEMYGASDDNGALS